MRTTNDIHSIDFTALAKLTKDNKTAGIIVLLAIDASSHGQVTLTNKAIIEATGIDRKTVSTALSHLRDKRILLRDPVCDKVYHINSCLLSTENPRSFEYYPEFSAKIGKLNNVLKVSRKDQREVDRMNKLSDVEIAQQI